MNEPCDNVGPRAEQQAGTPQVPVIGYMGPDVSDGRPSARRHFVWGMGFTLAYSVVAGAVTGFVAWSAEVVWMTVAAMEVVVFIALLVFVSRKVQSNAFVAGAMTALLLSPLVVVVICAMS